MTAIDRILDFTNGENFIRFGNSDGKYWIMPVRGMRTAMNLYQPSGMKGKMVKALLPHMHWLPPVRKAIHAELMCCSLKEELRTLLCKVFGVKEIEFSIFEGTPSVHQKITMQLSSGERILGYCKLSESNDIKELFVKEDEMLTWLERKGVIDIPKTLYCGTLDSGVHIFVQSTAKTASSSIIHEWGKLHEEFLTRLHDRTRQKMLFENSDYYKTLLALEEHIEWLPDNVDKKLIIDAVAKIRQEYCGHEVEFSAYHGDFTPWNMFVEKNRLFVFDFEYAAQSYPPGLDHYHFFTQTAIYEKKTKKHHLIPNADDVDLRTCHLLYLLSQFSLYTNRQKGVYDKQLKYVMKLWECRIKEIIN